VRTLKNIAKTWHTPLAPTQCVIPLAFYALLLYVCMRRSWRIPRGVWAIVAFSISWATIACAIFYHYDFDYWWGDGDQWSHLANSPPG
jgi:hypothetical protein